MAGFEDIQRFVEQHGRAPQHGEGRDIFERLYAVRLDRLRELDDCRRLLEPLDQRGLFGGTEPAPADAPDDISDDELLAQLGVDTRCRGPHLRIAACPFRRRQTRSRRDSQPGAMRGL